MEKYEIIIVGAGPGGLTAGMYAGRQNSKTLIIEKSLTGGQGSEVPLMENYPGFELIEGMELIEKMKKQTSKYCEIREMEEVLLIEKIEDGFNVHTTKDDYFSKSIILTTGGIHRHLNVSGESEFAGKGVSYCAKCDGFFFKGKDVLVIGGGNSAVQEALYLSKNGCNVSIVHRRDKLRCQKTLEDELNKNHIKIYWNSEVKKINGNMVVESVTINESGLEKEIKTNAVFIAIGEIPSNQLAIDLGLSLDEKGYVITDKNQKTSMDLVYAGGDVCGGLKQWIVSCGEGAIASDSAYKEINQFN